MGHPTQKPTEIIRRLVKALSYEGSLVLDFLLAQGPQGGYVLKKIAIQLWWILIIH